MFIQNRYYIIIYIYFIIIPDSNNMRYHRGSRVEKHTIRGLDRSMILNHSLNLQKYSTTIIDQKK